jgi:phosphohistidine phosphatase
MKRLVLLRHAQAEAARAGLPDTERCLSPHGRLQAQGAAQRLASAGLQIEALLVSPAVRTRETAAIVAAELDIHHAPAFEPALYLGSPEALLATVKCCSEELSTVLMVGHNPGLSQLAQLFQSIEAHTEPGVELRTAELCWIGFAPHTAWADISPQLALHFALN